MDAKNLLNLAITNAKKVSKDCPNEKVYLLWDNATEYTTCPERSLEMVKKAEPNLTLVAVYLNGEKVG